MNEHAAPPPAPTVGFLPDKKEFAKIYFVNLFLNILTLTLYSPWAKIRERKYLYGHLTINGQSFGYHADPWVLFRGRLLILAFVALYLFGGYFWMYLPGVVFLLFLAAMPWLIVRSLRFNMANTSFANRRFAFDGTVKGAFAAYLLWPLLGLLTLGLMYPYAVFKQKRFLFGNRRFANHPFVFGGSARPVFVIFFKALLLGLLLAGIGFFILMVSGSLMSSIKAEKSFFVFVFLAVLYLAMIALGMIVAAFVRVRLLNYVLNHLRLDTLGFAGRLGVEDLLLIYLKNLALIVLTLGIYLPWAKLNLMGYYAGHVELNGELPLGEAAAQDAPNAVGDEANDILDMDIAF